LSEVELQTELNRPGAVSLLVSYNDKYGPLGKIAVLLGQVESSVLTISTWVMSCRAFSRHIEYKCLEYLFENLSVSEIKLDFQPTPRNGPLQEFLSTFVDTELTTALTISRKTFAERQPRLAHKINEVSYV
jgi:predicted enzyme involved in methoxymalonyl-ACP biosynthesis